MNKYKKAIVFIILMFFVSSTFAIQVMVSSQSTEKVYALGFRLNGKDYGGPGSSYSRSNLPAGVYTFGLRLGGLIFSARDVGCYYHGKKSVALSKDTRAFLRYNGHSCSVSLSPSPR